MITTSDVYVLVEGSKVSYNGLNILTVPTVQDEDSAIGVEIRSVTDDGQIQGVLSLSFTSAEIDAFTGSGASDREKFFNQCEQAVKDHLEGITDNLGATFTIS
jgi:hypothetical protein